MTEPDAGLDLLPFLRLLRADLGVWLSLAAIVLVLGVMGWTSWGSRRALRKCLVLSIAAHVGLLMYGGGLDREGRSAKDGVPVAERIQSIRVADAAAADPQPPGTSGGKAIAGWDQPRDLPADDPPLRIAQRAVSPPEPMVRSALEAVAPPEARPPDLLAPEPARPDAAAIPEIASAEAPSPASANEIPVVEAPAAPPAEPEAASRVRSSRPAPARDVRPSTPVVADLPSATLPRDASPEIAAMNPMAPAPEVTSVAVAEPNPVANEAAVPDVDLRSRSRSRTTVPGRSTTGLAPVTIARGASSGSGASPIPLPSSRPISDVPEVYRDRLEPDRRVSV